MGKIQKILDKNSVEVYPVTHERAVKDSSGVTAETKFSKLSKLESEVDGVELDVFDADVHQVNAGSAIDTQSGNRLRLIYYVYPGCAVSASCSLGKGVSSAVYDSLSNALIASTNSIQTIQDGYVGSFVSTTVTVEGYLQISLCKSNESSFSTQDKADYLAATTVSIQKEGMDSKVEQIDVFSAQVNGIQYYKIVQHMAGSSTPSTSGNRVSVLFNIVPNANIRASADWGSGFFGAIWDTETNALVGSSSAQYGHLQDIRSDYSTAPLSGTSNYTGVLRIGTKKANDSAFTSEEISSFLSAFSYAVIKDSLLKEELSLEIPKILPWTAVFTNGVFNANNTEQRLECPELRIFDDSGSHSLQAQNINYNWGVNGKLWFALVVSDDFTTYNMVEWNELNYKSRLVAFIKRDVSNDTTVTRFYGGEGDAVFSIDGDNMEARLNEKIDSTNTRVLNGIFSGDNSNYVGTYYYGLAPGRKYKISFHEPGWNISSVVSGNTTRLFNIINVYNNTKTYLVDVKMYMGYVEPSYTFTIPSNSDYIEVGGRANAGVDVRFTIVDVTEVGENLGIGDFQAYSHNAGTSVVVSEGTRLSLFRPVVVGDFVKVVTSFGAGCVVQVWDSIQNGMIAPLAGDHMLQDLTPGSYTKNEVAGRIIAEGYLMVKYKKSDDTAITLNQQSEAIHDTTLELLTGVLADVHNTKEDLSSVADKSEPLEVWKQKKTNYCGAQGLTIVDNKIIHFIGSADDHSAFAYVYMWDMSFVGLQMMTHNLGHAATVDYSDDFDSLVIGNGTLDNSVKPRIDIIPNASSRIVPGATLSYTDSDIIHIELSTSEKELGGSGMVCTFGGNGRIVYLGTGQTAPTKLFRCILGVGSEDFSDHSAGQNDATKWGTFISGKEANEYNGTLKVLSSYVGDDLGTYQGMCYRNGFIYLSCGMTTPIVHKVSLLGTGLYRIEQSVLPVNYNVDGTVETAEPEGLCFLNDTRMLLGIPNYGGLFEIYSF